MLRLAGPEGAGSRPVYRAEIQDPNAAGCAALEAGMIWNTDCRPDWRAWCLGLLGLALWWVLARPASAAGGTVEDASRAWSYGVSGCVTAASTSAGDSPALRDRRRIVQVTTADGIVLEGAWTPPRNEKKRIPAVLLLHDAGGDRERLTGIAARLAREGLAVLAIDLRGHGGSRRKETSWAQLGDVERTRTWVQSLRDASAALAWIAVQPGVDSGHLGILGEGAAAALAARSARQDGRITGVVLLEPPSRTTFGFDLRSDLEALEGMPTLLVLGEGDDAQEFRKLVDRMGPDPAHGFELLVVQRESPRGPRVVTSIAKFLKRATGRKGGAVAESGTANRAKRG